MSDKILMDKCPECGEPLEASARVYLDNCRIVQLPDGTVECQGDDTSKGNLGVEFSLYCPNDHETAIVEALDEFPTRVKGLRGGMYGT